ncbi:MAG: Ig-like domain-containing protein [Propionibacteriaceae bacterium]|nr:Ig-like domain-containing protein [Propionibacteriaceae bacterium]
MAEADFTWSSVPAGVAVKPGSFVNNGDGTYGVLVYTTKAGVYTLTATVQGQPATATVTFRALPPSSANAHFAINPTVAYMGQTAEAVLSLFDRFDNPVDIAFADITLTVPAGVTQSGPPVKEVDAFGNATGVYKFALAGQAGSYVVAVAVDDEDGHLVSRQAAARWIFAATSHVKLTVVPLTHVVSTAAESGVLATVRVTDSNGFPVNNLTEAELNVTSNPAGVQIKPGSFANHGDGSYSYLLYATKSTSYTVTAAHGAVSDTSPVTFFTAGPPAAGTVRWSVVPSLVQLPHTATASLTVKDAFTNPVTGLQAADIVIGQTPSGVTVTGPVEQSDANGPTGVYVYTLSATAPGVHTMTATVKDSAGGDITLSDSVEFSYGSLGSVSLALSHQSHRVSSEQGAAVTATVTVLNDQGVAVDNLTAGDFTLASAPTGVNVKTGSFANLGSGAYSFLVYTTASGAYQLTASVQGMTDSAAVEFTAGAPNSSRTTWVIAPGQVTVPGQAVGRLTVRDQFGNPVTGLQPADITMTPSPVAPPLQVARQPESPAEPGVYVFVLSSPAAQAYDVEAKVAMVVKSAPLAFSPGDVDPGNSTVTAAPSTQRAGQAIEVTVTVRDGHGGQGNLISDLTASDFQIQGTPTPVGSTSPAIVGDSFVNRGAGVYTFAITSKAADEFVLSAVVAGVPLTDRPTVVFTAAGVCVANCETTDPDRRTRAVMVLNDQLNNGKDKDSARLHAFDTYGNPVSGAEAVATRTDAALQPETQTVKTGGDGTALLEWTSLSIGTFTATVAVDGLTGFDGSVLNQIRFVTTGVSALDSDLTVTAPAGLTAPLRVGQAYSAEVVVRDAQKQELAGVPVSFESPDPALDLSAPFCHTGPTGACSVTVTAKLMGKYPLHATVSVGGVKTDVANSPAELEFVAGPVCAAQCAPVDPTHVTGVRLTKNGQPADNQSANEAVVSAYDVYGNPVAAAWSTAPGANVTATPATGATGADGQATVAYTTLISGTYPVAVDIAGQPAPGSPLQVTFAAWAASEVVLTVIPQTPVTVGSPVKLTAAATDLGGAAVTGVLVEFTAPAAVEFAAGKSSCLTEGQGVCSVEVTSKLAGAYDIDGHFSGTPLTNAPATVEFRAVGVCVTGCTPVDPTQVTRAYLIKNGANFNGFDQDVAEVAVYDRFGNPVSGAAVTSATTDQDLAIQPNIQPTGLDGKTTIWYTSQDEGSHEAAVAVAGLVPAGSPLALAFGAGSGEPSRSAFTIAPKLSSAQAPLAAGDAAANTYVVTATISDAAGTPAAGDTVTFFVNPTGPAWGGGKSVCQTNAKGVCSVEVYSTKAGSFTLAAVLPRGPIGLAKPVAWAADEVCGAECTPEPGVTETTRAEVVVDRQTADGATPDVVRVYAFDKWGNPVPNALVTSAPGAGAVGLRVQQGINPTDSATGQSTVDYYSTVAGAQTADIVVGGKTPTGSPVTLNFEPGGICLAPACLPDPTTPNDRRSRIEVVANGQVADGQTADVVRVFAFDRWGNPVPNAAVQAAVAASSGVAVTAPIPATDAKGEADVEFTSAKAVVDEPARLYLMVGGQAVEVVFTPQPHSTPPAAMQSSPAALTFTAGAMTDARSSWTVSPAALPVDQTATAVFRAADAQGNPVKGLTSADFVLDANGLVVLSGPNEDEPGKYVWTLTTKRADAYVVEVTAGGFAKSAGVVFQSGPPDPQQSAVAVSPAVQTAGQRIYVTVSAADSHRNPVLGLTAADFAVAAAPTAANPTLPALSGADFLDLGDGRYRFDLTSALAGDFEVAATVQGVVLDDRPGIEFTAGGVCVSHCQPVDPTHVTRAEMVVNDQVNDGVSEDTARVFAYDNYGNPVKGAAVVSVRQDSALEPASHSATTDDAGVAFLAWKSRSVGAFTATVAIDGVNGFDGSVLNQIRFMTTGVDATRSVLAVAPPTGQTAPILAGEAYTAQVTVRDAQDSFLRGVAVSFAVVPASGAPAGATAALSAPACTTGPDGTCSVQVTARVAADYELRATAPVAGAATAVSGSPAVVGFRAGPVCVVGCAPVDPTHVTRVEVTKNGQKAGGASPDEAVLYAFDHDGNPVAGAVWSSAAADAKLTVVTPSGVTGPDGTAQLAYASAYSGTHQATVSVDGSTPSGSPLSLSFAAGDVHTASLAASPAGPLTVGQTYTLTATAADLAGSPVVGVAVDFAGAAAVAFAGGQTSCVTGPHGDCSVQVTALAAGRHEVAADRGGTALTGSPLALEWEAGAVCVTQCQPADPSHVTRVEIVKNGAAFNGVDRNVVKLYAYDRHGNPVSGQSVAVAAVSALSVQPAIAPTDDDGTTTVWFTSKTAGFHDAAVMVAGLTPAGSPVRLGFGGGEGDPGQSSFTVTPKSAGATAPLTVGDGPDSVYAVTAVVNDYLGYPVDGVTVSFAVDPAGTSWLSGQTACQTVGGVCSADIHATAAGSYSIAATLPRGAVAPTKTATWLVGEVCGVGCQPDPGVGPDRRSRVEVTRNHQTADDVSADVVAVYAFDRWGNPVKNQLVVSTSADAALRIQTGIAATDGQGVSTVRYYSAQPGVYEAALTVGGKTPAQSPVSLAFLPGDICMAPSCVPDPSVPNDRRTRLEVVVDDQPADGRGQDVVRLFAFDRLGHAVPGVTAEAVAADASKLTVTVPAPATGAAGVMDFLMASRTAGPHEARVYVLAGGAPVEVVFTPQPQPPAAGPAPAGMVSSPITLNFVDVTAPAAPVVTGPADGGDLDEARPVISGTGEPGAVVTVDDGGTAVCETVVAADGTWSCVPDADLGEGGHTLTATQEDAAGNVSTPSAPITVTVDTVAPDPPVVLSPAAGQAVADGTPVVTGTAEPGTTVTVVDETGRPLCAAQADATGAWSCESAALGDGPHTVTVTATDPTGNTSAPAAVDFTVDTDPPAALVIATPAEGQVLNDAFPAISGTAEADTLVTVREGGAVVCSAVAVGGTWSCSPAAPLAEGSHAVAATAADAAGNVSPVATRAFEIDLTAPPAPVVTAPAAGSTVDPTQPVEVVGVAEPGSWIEVSVGPGNTCSAQADADGLFACVLPQPLPEGPSVIEVTAADAAGNVSPAAHTPVDGKTPVVVPPRPPTVDTSDPTQITGTSDPDTVVTVTDESGRQVCVAWPDAEGHWSCEVTQPLRPGDEITVSAEAPDGGKSDLTVRVLGIVLKAASLSWGDEQTATGLYFQPGEVVTAVMRSDLVVLGSAVVRADGTAVFTWTIADDVALGGHTVVLTGSVSGPVIGRFQVSSPAPATGGGVSRSVAMAAAVAVLLGSWCLVMWRRRRDDEPPVGRHAA